MSLIANSFYNIFTRGLLFFSGFITSVLLASLLGAQGKGILSAVNLIPTLIAVFLGFRFGSALVYYQSKFPKKANLFFSSSFVFFLFWTPVLIITTLILYPVFKTSYFKDIPFYYYFLCSSVLSINFFNQIYASKLMSSKNFLHYNLVRAASAYITIGLYANFIIFFSDKIFGAIMAGICGQIVYLILVVYYSKSAVVFHNSKKMWIAFKLMFRYSYKTAFSGITNFLNTRFDFLMVKYYLNASSFAFYTISVLLSEILLYIPGSVTVAVFPEFVSMSGAERKKLYNKVFLINLVTMIFVLIALYLFVPFLIMKFYGKEFMPAVKSFNYLIIGVFFLGLYKINETYFAGGKKLHFNMISSLSMFLVNFCLNLYFIPKLGINGAAISSSIAYFSGFLLSCYFLHSTKL